MPTIKTHLPMPVAQVSLADPTTVTQIADQLKAQYAKACSAEQRIAEANLDLVLFGGMLAQIEGELAKLGGGKRGPGAIGLKAWLSEHAQEIDFRRASELKILATKIAEEYSLEIGELRGLLSAGEEVDLPTGASTKRRKILEVLGAGSIHRLHMQFGSRKHGGARQAAPKPQLTPAEMRDLRLREVASLISQLNMMALDEKDTLIWLEPSDAEQAANNLQRVVDAFHAYAKAGGNPVAARKAHRR